MSNSHSNTLQNQNSNHSDDVYYFSHIPKTGGTSFTVILDRFFHVNEIFKPQLWWEVGDIKKVREDDYRCIRGHFGMGAQSLSNHPLKHLTIIRNPLKMAYSTYQYIRREQNTRVHQYVTENNLSFEAFLQDPKTRNLAKNRMTKSLSFGMGLLTDQQDLVITRDNYKFYRKQWNKDLKTMSQDKVLEIVKTYLKSCFWVGILEQFELSLLVLCDQMNWSVIGPTEKLNKHPKEPVISENAKCLVKEMNHMDYELYDFANVIQKQKIEAIDFNNQEIQSINLTIDAKYQKNHIKQYGISLAEQIIYDFSMPLLGQNWHRREWSDLEDSYFRWTGPVGETTIDFWLKPQSYSVSLTFINLLGIELLKTLVIKINNQTVEWRTQVKDKAGVIFFEFEESFCQRNGLIRLSLLTDQLNSHDSVYQSNDKRRVGFAMKSIKVLKRESVVT